MTEERMRIKIAEARGLRWQRNPIDDAEVLGVLPNYTHDLNAMHEAEESLWGDDWAEYFDLLQRTGKATGVRATARQRAEAFLRALNLWEEE